MGFLNEYATDIHETAVDVGWHDDGDNPVGLDIALMHTELSEALEEWRKGFEPKEVYHIDGEPKGVPIELADVIIRVLHFAAVHGIDMDEAFAAKVAYNRTREHRHGGKRA